MLPCETIHLEEVPNYSSVESFQTASPQGNEAGNLRLGLMGQAVKEFFAKL